METPKIVVFVIKRYAVREAKKMAVRNTQCQNRAIRSTQGGGGVTLTSSYACVKLCNISLSLSLSLTMTSKDERSASVLLFI